MPAPAHELGLWSNGGGRYLHRDKGGRFARLERSPERIAVLKKAKKMRAQLGLPPLPILSTLGDDND